MGDAGRGTRGVNGEVNRRTTAPAEPDYPREIDLFEQRVPTVEVGVVQQRRQRGPLL